MMKINQIKFLYWSVAFLVMMSIVDTALYPLVVGSRTAVSIQPQTTFPASDTNNTMLGFAAFNQGFILQDITTTCTYDNYFPIAGDTKLNNGRLYLKQDLTFANTHHFYGGGKVYGKNHSIEFVKHVQDFNLPEGAGFFVGSNLALMGLTNDPYSVDWEVGDAYVAGCSAEVSSVAELKIGYFDGSIITTTLSVEHGRDVYAVRYHPTKRYLALGRASGSGNEVIIYEHKVHNGTLPVLSGAAISGAATALAWHPSGNYLVVGTDNNAGEIVSYAVSSGGVIGASTSVNLSPDRDVTRNSLSFSPGGNQIIVGVTNNATANVSELLVYNFNGSLTLTSSLDVGATVQAVDWCPTGSYVAVGLTGGTTNLRLYDVSGSPIHIVSTATQSLSEDIYGLHWDSTGTYLLVVTQSGSVGTLYIYQFDSTAKTLTAVFSRSPLKEQFACRWSRSNNYFAYTFEYLAHPNYQVAINAFDADALIPLYFDNTALVFNCDVNIKTPIHFSGICKINGRGKRVFLNPGSEFVIRPNSQLILEDCELQEVEDSRLRCLMGNGSILIRNSILNLSSEYTFSLGSIQFEEDVLVTGFGKFNYTNCQSSTIAFGAILTFDNDTTFSYAPQCPRRDLIFMEDNTSALVLNGCTLVSTRTGLELTAGILVIDDKVTMSSQARYPAEGIMLDSSLDTRIKGGSTLDLYGYIRYN